MTDSTSSYKLCTELEKIFMNFDFKDQIATEQEIYQAIEAVTQNMNYKLPLTSLGVLALKMFVEQELAKKNKFAGFRLVVSAGRKVEVVYGNPSDYGWEDYTEFEQDGKRYVMFPDPLQH